jgi:hypothetical protein
MKRALLGVISLVTIAALVILVGIGRRILKHFSPSSDLFSMIPSDAPVRGFIDLSALRKTQFYANRPDGLPLWMPGGNFVNLMQAAEADSQDNLDRLVIASWPGKTPLERGKTIVVAEGRFNSAKIRDYATQHGKIDRQQGREVFSMSGHGEGTRNSLVFLNDSHVAVINSASVAQLLGGSGKSSKDPMRERANQLSDALAFVIIHFPEYPDIFAGQGTVVLQSESLARMVDWGSFSLRPDGKDMRLSFEGECKTQTNAKQLQSTIELFRQFVGPGMFSFNGGRQIDPARFANLQNQLRNAEIKITDNRVDALIRLSPESWKAMASLPAR